MALSSSGLGRSPLKAKTGVRIPVGSLVRWNGRCPSYNRGYNQRQLTNSLQARKRPKAQGSS
jgi:hypothetical protein